MELVDDGPVVLQHTLDGLPYGVTVWRAESERPDDLRLVYANARASTEVGLDLQAMVGTVAREFLNTPSLEPPAPGNSKTHAPAAPEGGLTANYTIPHYVYTDTSGRVRELRVHLVPIWERTVAFTYEQLGTVPEGDEPGEHVREYFEDIVRTLREPLAVVDASLRVVWVNEVFRKVYLRDGTEPLSLLQVASDADRASLERGLLRVLPDDQPLEGAEVRLTATDGTQRACLLNARRLNARDSATQLMLVAIEEVTERRRREALQRAFVEAQVRARDEERRAMARELHDRIGQSLTSYTVLLQRLKNMSDLASAHKQASELHVMVEELLKELGCLVGELHPYRLEQLGLIAALRQHLREFEQVHRLKVEFEVAGWEENDERLAPDLEIGLYRIVQEALANVARHAEANRVSVTLHRDADTLRILIEDDGRGFDAAGATSSGGLGLVALGERARLMRGLLNIESTPGEGTTVMVSVPLDSAPQAV